MAFCGDFFQEVGLHVCEDVLHGSSWGRLQEKRKLTILFGSILSFGRDYGPRHVLIVAMEPPQPETTWEDRLKNCIRLSAVGRDALTRASELARSLDARGFQQDAGTVEQRGNIPLIGACDAAPAKAIEGPLAGPELALKEVRESIPVEERGITLAQLRRVYAQIEHRCLREGWKNRDGKQLQPAEVNLYDLNKYLLMPDTKEKRVSYVEHITGGVAQTPQWFVSHWWGEPVADFIACIEQHAADRGLGDDVPYWVCAYANNQHHLAPLVNPDASPFRKALDLSVGTVTVLDQGGMCYTRVWCVYEIYTTMQSAKDKSFYYDIYTAKPHHHPQLGTRKAVGLSDLSGEQERDKSASGLREQFFPLDLAERAFEVSVRDAQASVEEDRLAIHESIKRSSPETGDEAFASLDRALHARFALLVGTQLANRGLYFKADNVLSNVLDWMGRERQSNAAVDRMYGRHCAEARLALARVKYRQQLGAQAVSLATLARLDFARLQNFDMEVTATIQLARFHDVEGAPRKHLEKAVSTLRQVLEKLALSPSDAKNQARRTLRAEALGYLAHFITIAACNFGRERPEEATELLEEALLLTSGATDEASQMCRLMVLDKKAGCYLRPPALDPGPTIAASATLALRTSNAYYLTLSKQSQARCPCLSAGIVHALVCGLHHFAHQCCEQQ